MSFKIWGAICIILSCSAVGFIFALNVKKEIETLKQFISDLGFMKCELQYRRTPLPILCNLTASISKGKMHSFFEYVTQELENQVTPDAEKCMLIALEKCKDMPAAAKKGIQNLAATLGRFDLEGQITGIEAVYEELCQQLTVYNLNLDKRIRSYRTLGICAGAALAILLL